MATWQPPTLTNRPIIVLGGTSIGRRIACTWLSAGFNVHIQETDVQIRAWAFQYALDNVESYMKRIGSTRRGVISASAVLDVRSSFNPWLVIEAMPEQLTEEATANFNVQRYGELDNKLPDDCILCLNALSNEKVLLGVQRHFRILTLHHYVLPNIRVVEMVKFPHTDNAVVDFLFKVIPRTGSLPILANDRTSAGDFQILFLPLKKEACGKSKDLGATDIDNGWDYILFCSTLVEMEDWFEYLGREIGDSLERLYTKREHPEKSILFHVKDTCIEEGKMAPYAGRGSKPISLMRPGPNIFFVDIGHLESAAAKCGRILCGSTDGTVREVVTNLCLPYGLSVDYASKRVYWSDLAEGTISSCNYDGKQPRIMVPKNGDAAPKQIAIDQTNSQIYWNQSEGTQILRCNADGTHIECVLDIGVNGAGYLPGPNLSPNGIAVDPSRRHFYWSRPSRNRPDKHMIQRASMDLPAGFSPSRQKDVETLFDGLALIHDIDFVPVFDELYWSVKHGVRTEIHRGYVGTCPDYGMHKQNVVIKDLKGTGWLRVDPKSGHFYTTCVVGSLTRYDMTTGKGEFKMYKNDNASFAGLSLMYGDLDWRREACEEAASGESGTESQSAYKSAKGRIIGLDGADDLNSESTGTLSSVSGGEIDTSETEGQPSKTQKPEPANDLGESSRRNVAHRSVTQSTYSAECKSGLRVEYKMSY